MENRGLPSDDYVKSVVAAALDKIASTGVSSNGLGWGKLKSKLAEVVASNQYLPLERRNISTYREVLETEAVEQIWADLVGNNTHGFEGASKPPRKKPRRLPVLVPMPSAGRRAPQQNPCLGSVTNDLGNNIEVPTSHNGDQLGSSGSSVQEAVMNHTVPGSQHMDSVACVGPGASSSNGPAAERATCDLGQQALLDARVPGSQHGAAGGQETSAGGEETSADRVAWQLGSSNMVLDCRFSGLHRGEHMEHEDLGVTVARPMATGELEAANDRATWQPCGSTQGRVQDTGLVGSQLREHNEQGDLGVSVARLRAFDVNGTAADKATLQPGISPQEMEIDLRVPGLQQEGLRVAASRPEMTVVQNLRDMGVEQVEPRTDSAWPFHPRYGFAVGQATAIWVHTGQEQGPMADSAMCTLQLGGHKLGVLTSGTSAPRLDEPTTMSTVEQHAQCTSQPLGQVDNARTSLSGLEHEDQGGVVMAPASVHEQASTKAGTNHTVTSKAPAMSKDSKENLQRLIKEGEELIAILKQKKQPSSDERKRIRRCLKALMLYKSKAPAVKSVMLELAKMQQATAPKPQWHH